jgi:chemotaxis protein methyltransferase CheR
VGGLITLTEQQFKVFQAFIYRHTGIWTQDGKVSLLSNRIRRRLGALGLESFDAYHDILAAGTVRDVVSSHGVDLETVFLALTGRSVRD